MIPKFNAKYRSVEKNQYGGKSNAIHNNNMITPQFLRHCGVVRGICDHVGGTYSSDSFLGIEYNCSCSTSSQGLGFRAG